MSAKLGAQKNDHMQDMVIRTAINQPRGEAEHTPPPVLQHRKHMVLPTPLCNLC